MIGSVFQVPLHILALNAIHYIDRYSVLRTPYIMVMCRGVAVALYAREFGRNWTVFVFRFGISDAVSRTDMFRLLAWNWPRPTER